MDAISRRVSDSDPPRDSICTDVSQADLLLVAPLSHETLAEIACGIVLDLLTEIVRNNEEVCSKVDESMIQHFARCISQRGRRKRMMDFFGSVLSVRWDRLKRMQELVMAALFGVCFSLSLSLSSSSSPSFYLSLCLSLFLLSFLHVLLSCVHTPSPPLLR